MCIHTHTLRHININKSIERQIPGTSSQQIVSLLLLWYLSFETIGCVVCLLFVSCFVCF